MFALAGAEHEFADGFAGVFSFFEDELHLFGDGHFDVALASEFECGAGGEDAFSNFSTEALEDLGEFAALAESLTHGAVARERSGASEDEIADAAESGESLGVSAAGYGEARHLSYTTGDERSA